MSERARRNLILAGFMGAGKSTVARLVAERLAMPLLDSDALVEEAAGQTITELVAAEGEDQFRQLEAEICRQAAEAHGQVIATGGGALLDEAVRKALEASGAIICLSCEFDEILRRLGDGAGRPLFNGDAYRLAALLAERQAHYDSLPHQIDTTESSPAQVADEVIALWRSL